MKPFSFSNKVNNTLLFVPAGLLAYFLMELTTILNGAAIISGPIYPLYITVGILILIIVSLAISIILRAKRESRQNKGRILKGGLKSL
ncbi:MAG: hypothetical protein M1113_00435 [Candidatus Thermoplasmatota archaeon]|nr:hypothetical protein [Candidatus Thermoplasmatota archaeon]